MTSPKIQTRLISRREACKTLGISLSSFDRHWHVIFTDPREPERRVKLCTRRVYEDEVAIALEAGGGMNQTARMAVLAFRAGRGRR